MPTLTPEELKRLARVRAVLNPHNLTPKQFEILRLLADRSPRTLTEIGEAIGLDQPQSSRLTAQLEAGGWVTRNRHPIDYRSKVVDLTKPPETIWQIANEIETPAPAA